MTSPLLTHRTVGSLHAGDLGRTISIEVLPGVEAELCSGVIARVDHEAGYGASTTFVGLEAPGLPGIQNRGRRWPSTQLCTVM